MAICLTCPCGASIEIPDEDASEWGSCPLCGVIVYLPPEDGIMTSPARPAAPAARGAPQGPILKSVIRARRRETTSRREHLRWVDWALVFHYAVPFLFLAGSATGTVALVLAMSARFFDWQHAAQAASFFFRAGGLFLCLTGFAAALASTFGLIGRPPRGEWELLASLGLFAAGSCSAAVLAALPVNGTAQFLTTLGILAGAWACWLSFLRHLAPALRRPEVAEGAMQTLWGGLKALALTLPVGLVIGLLIAVMVKRPICALFIPVAGVGALIAVVFHVGSFDSVTGLLLAPTGIPFALEYLGFTSGLRVLIQRRC